ncbi:MAG: short-chain dehydrogenase [Desulfobulbaceae bacterium BRH_c16a]|nr:MAG: short-chain dehydrogenase [Desulfobulbaceae bacterium BRH_c16a]
MKILVTGATSGIGRQLAIDYHKLKNEVWAIGRNESQLNELESLGLHTARVDLNDREASLAWFAGLTSLDLAVLNAGTCEYIDLPDFDSRLVRRVMRGNVESMAVSIEGVLPLLRKGVKPHLVGVGSSAAYVPLPRAEAYGASKAAVAYLIDALRIDLQREGIDVSLVSPGFVKTPLTDRNDFPMPFRVTVEEASFAIRQGIARRRAEVHFPRRFTLPLKLLAWLPRTLWSRLAQYMVNP